MLSISPEENRLYSIMVSDTNGCSKTEIINIKVNPNPKLFVSQQDANCPNNNGAIVIDSVLGIASPYRYSKDGGVWQTAPVYGGLSEGEYSISVIDTNSCVSTQEIIVNEVNNTVANFSYSSPLPFAPTSLTFTNQSQNASEYQWFVNGALTNITPNLTEQFELAGDYQLTLVASKANELCSDTLTKIINLEQEKHLFLSSLWKTGDNLILYSYGYEQLTFTLVNGLGQQVLQKEQPITNGNNIVVGQKSLARGVYFYEVKAKDEFGNTTVLSGKLVRM